MYSLLGPALGRAEVIGGAHSLRCVLLRLRRCPRRTTVLGRGGGPCEFSSCRTIYSLTSGGTLTTLHSFDNTDGSEPSGGLVQATNTCGNSR